MRHTRLTRAFAALLAVWFTINMVAPGRLYSCPVHDAAVGAGATTAPEHGQHMAHHGNSHEKTPQHLCHCMSSCCPVALVMAPAATQIGATEVTVAAPGLPPYEYALVARAHQLPFANGPPSA
jgi:hypothetical protein